MSAGHDKPPNSDYKFPGDGFEAWKHFGSIGGSDKDKMIQIVTWLLGFSAAIVGFQAEGKAFLSSESNVIGIVVSLLGAGIALLYGSYAAWNWAIADAIANVCKWEMLKPDYEPIDRGEWNTEWSFIVQRFARPCHGKIAPIFWIFFVVSLGFVAIHSYLFYKHVL